MREQGKTEIAQPASVKPDNRRQPYEESRRSVPPEPPEARSGPSFEDRYGRPQRSATQGAPPFDSKYGRGESIPVLGSSTHSDTKDRPFEGAGHERPKNELAPGLSVDVLEKIKGAGMMTTEELARTLNVPHTAETQDLLEKIRQQSLMAAPPSKVPNLIAGKSESMARRPSAPDSYADNPRRISQQTSYGSNMSISEESNSSFHEDRFHSRPPEFSKPRDQKPLPKAHATDLAVSMSSRAKVQNYLEHYTEPPASHQPPPPAGFQGSFNSSYNWVTTARA